MKHILKHNGESRLQDNYDLAYPVDALKLKPDHKVRLQSLLNVLGHSHFLPEHDVSVLLERLADKDESMVDLISMLESNLLQLIHHSQQTQQAINKSMRIGLSQLLPLNKPLLQDFAYTYAALLNQRPRTSGNVAKILSDYFSLPIKIIENTGQWQHVERQDQSQLSITKPQYNQLGSNLMIGQKVFDTQHHFLVMIGPLTYTALLKLLPSKSTLQRMKDMLHYMVSRLMNFSILVLVEHEQAKPLSLSRHAPCQLGWNSWLGQAKTPRQYKITLNANPIQR